MAVQRARGYVLFTARASFCSTNTPTFPAVTGAFLLTPPLFDAAGMHPSATTSVHEKPHAPKDVGGVNCAKMSQELGCCNVLSTIVIFQTGSSTNNYAQYWPKGKNVRRPPASCGGVTCV